MKLYLAGGSPKPHKNIVKNLLFTYYGIKYPVHRFGIYSDFKFFINENIPSSNSPGERGKHKSSL